MKIRKLNALRGLAAMIVVISHYSNTTNLWGNALGAGAGQFGVMLFFILSGFLMSHLYMNKDFDKQNVRHFAAARIARVIPLFVLVVLISYFLHIAGLGGVFYDIGTKKALLSHLLMLSGVSVLWTIPPEVQFYVMFVGLWWLYSERKGYLFTLMVSLFCGLVFLHFPDPEWRVFGLDIQGSLIRSLPYFLVGVIFGQLYGTWQAPEYLRKNIFALALLIIPLMFPNIFKFLMGYSHTTWTDAGVFFVVSAVFFALIFLVPEDNAVLASRVGDFLGMISYSLYLLHLPILALIAGPASQAPVLFLPLYVAATLGVAYVSYKLIEAPARRGIRSIAMGGDGAGPTKAAE